MKANSHYAIFHQDVDVATAVQASGGGAGDPGQPGHAGMLGQVKEQPGHAGHGAAREAQFEMPLASSERMAPVHTGQGINFWLRTRESHVTVLSPL